MTIEDFTTYVKVDGRLTVTANKVEGANVPRTENVLLYKDFGVDYFNALHVEFEIYIVSTSQLLGQAGMAFANVIGSLQAFGTTEVTAEVSRISEAYLLRLLRGKAVSVDTYTISANTIYYCVLKRVAGGDEVTLEIYSDSIRTDLLATLEVDGFGVATKYRYCYGFINNNTGTEGREFDGYVRNLDLSKYRVNDALSGLDVASRGDLVVAVFAG